MVSPENPTGAEINGLIGDSEGFKDKASKKRFVELGSILEPGRPPRTGKAAILVDAVWMVVTLLRTEAQKLKDSNKTLPDKIKELKAEKNKLHHEKQRLKSKMEKLEEQLLKGTTEQPSFMPPPVIPAVFASQAQSPGDKLVPLVRYPGVSMWQFMPPATVDASQDHVLCPPVEATTRD